MTNFCCAGSEIVERSLELPRRFFRDILRLAREVEDVEEHDDNDDDYDDRRRPRADEEENRPHYFDDF